MMITISRNGNQCILVSIKELTRVPTKGGLKLQPPGTCVALDNAGITIANTSNTPVYVRWA